MAHDRTALAWTRSALNIAGSGTLIARAGFVANLDALGIASAVATAAVAFATWHHGLTLYRERGLAAAARQQQTAAFGLLTVATLLTAAAAIVVSVAI